MLCIVTIQLEKRICECELIKDYLFIIVLLSCIWNVHNLLKKRRILYLNDELFNNEVNIININVSFVILQGNYDEVKNDDIIYNSIKEKNKYKEEYY